MWRSFKEGKLRRSQRLLLAGNLKYLRCEERPILDEVLKYTDKVDEWVRWFEEDDVEPVPIIRGKTIPEHFEDRLF